MFPLICLIAKGHNALASVRIFHISGKTMNDHLQLILCEHTCDKLRVVNRPMVVHLGLLRYGGDRF